MQVANFFCCDDSQGGFVVCVGIIDILCHSCCDGCGRLSSLDSGFRCALIFAHITMINDALRIEFKTFKAITIEFVAFRQAVLIIRLNKK
jgi:hypothetical protein